MKKVRFDPVEKSVAAEQRDPEFCCQITYKGASTVVILLEILYWLYYVLILVFAIVKHRQAWSIVILSVNLSLLALQIVAAGVGVWKEKPRLLQTHLVFLLLTMIWDLCMTTGFFILAVYPKAKEDQLIDYKGAEFNARTFGVVMGSLMVMFFVIRFISTWIIWKYWNLLHRRERRNSDAQYYPLPTKEDIARQQMLFTRSSFPFAT
ncbi:hypothetical protein V3C99_013605 [Haemonchus contortus]